MLSKGTSLDELKRRVYLWIVPFIVLALIIFNLIEPGLSSNELFYIYISRILIVWNITSWILLFKNRFMRFAELSNLILVSFAHIVTVFDAVFYYMIPGKEGALGISTMWTPLVFTYFFLTLKSRIGVIYSFGIYGITLIFSILNIREISPEYLLPLSQYLVANLIYIIMLYFAQQMFKVYAELEIAKRSAYIDSLTGIANRYKIDTWLEGKIEEAQKYRTPFSVIFFDIDFFKKINDTYGHLKGDYVLKEITAIVSHDLPEGNHLGRWGGEEFIIISNMPSSGALHYAEQLRKTIESHEFHSIGTITSSFGVASFLQGDTVDSLLGRADMALYSSKTNGRNRVKFIPREMKE
jgi:diguanylate cyclase (GGDEF)-like protein